MGPVISPLEAEMYVDLEEHLESLPESSPEIVDIRVTQHEFPDALGFRAPDGRLLLCSPAATPIVDSIEVGHDAEGRTYVIPYSLKSKNRVCSDPPVIYVGAYVKDGFGESPDPGLEEYLEHLELPVVVRKLVRDHFLRHAPCPW